MILFRREIFVIFILVWCSKLAFFVKCCLGFILIVLVMFLLCYYLVDRPAGADGFSEVIF